MYGYSDEAPALPSIARQRAHAFATLSDIPEFFTDNFKQLMAVTFGKYASYHGVLIHGPRNVLFMEGDAKWGRSTQLPSCDKAQMRVWPKEALFTEEGSPQVPLVIVCTRVRQNGGKGVNTTCCILFKPGHIVAEHDLVNIHRVVGCRGIHVMLAGFWKRHNPLAGGIQTHVRSAQSWQYDQRNFENIRATSHSLYEKVNATVHQTDSHYNAIAAKPGASIITVAGELIDVCFEQARFNARHVVPVDAREYFDETKHRYDILCSEDKELGSLAFTSATAIAELLSGAGLVGMLANPTFADALPDGVALPSSSVMVSLVLGMRLAIYWKYFGMPEPSATEKAANDQLRIAWSTCEFASLPGMTRDMMAIDVAIYGAITQAKSDVDLVKKSRRISNNVPVHIVDDHLVFFQRAGQNLITSVFGLGAGVVDIRDSRMGTPTKLQDNLQMARDAHLFHEGILNEGSDQPIVGLASVGHRRTAVIEMVLQMERYLRTGMYRNQRLEPENTAKSVPGGVLGELLWPLLRAEYASKLEKNPKEAKSTYAKFFLSVWTELNESAINSTVPTIKTLLTCGPQLHLGSNCGAFVIAPSQTTPCTDCERPVHVLEGAAFNHIYSDCAACFAPRCLDCVEAHAKDVRDFFSRVKAHQDTTAQQVGKRCCRCLAPPAVHRLGKAPNDTPATGMTLLIVAERVSPVTEGEPLATPPSKKGAKGKK